VVGRGGKISRTFNLALLALSKRLHLLAVTFRSPFHREVGSRRESRQFYQADLLECIVTQTTSIKSNIKTERCCMLCQVWALWRAGEITQFNQS
jgi:hypothetical protein